MNQKLEVKDLISIGIFSALYIIVMMAIVSVMGTLVVTYLLAPLAVALVCGSIYMIHIMRVPKPGSVMILSVLLSLLFIGASLYASVWALLIGLAVEIYLRGNYDNLSRITNSFVLFATTTIGPYIGIFFAKANFIASASSYYGEAYASTLDKMTPPWILILMFIVTALSGYLGGKVATRILKKHFKRAGIV